MWHRRLAWSWVALVVVALTYNIKIWFVDHRGLETDFLALLPASADDPIVGRAFERVAEAAQQDVVVLVGSRDWGQAQTAARAYSAVIARRPGLLVPASLTALASDSAMAPWWNNRRSLLTDDDRALLRSGTNDTWVPRAMRDLVSPIGTGRVGAWQDDPFGTFRRWLQVRATDSPVRPVNGVLRVDDGDMRYVALPMRLTSEAFALTTQRAVAPLFVEARDAALRIAPEVRVLAAGMVFPAAAAAAQANVEFNTIGWGSILGIVLVTWITFRSLRPIGMVLLSLAVGTLAAIAVTAWWYPQLHLLTLVFGASLIGVAEDYGMHYLCVRDRQRRGRLAVVRDSLPGLSLALLTTVASFVGLGISPFPGLRQIAVFSAVGLISAWLTVMLWFPALDGSQVGSARVVAWFDALRARWTRFSHGRGRWGLAALTTLTCVAGLSRLAPDDDIRLLQSLPAAMLHEQAEVGRILQQPFSEQFFVVRGASADEVLVREEALRVQLDRLIQRQLLVGYQSISSWVPSAQTQRNDAALVAERLNQRAGPLDQLRTLLGEDDAWASRLRRPPIAAVSLSMGTWTASPISEPLRPLWLGRHGDTVASVVTLKGVAPEQTPTLEQAAALVPGVRWADQVASISSVLRTYRIRMSWVLAASYLAIWLLFLPRYGRSAWRVLAPSVLASMVSLATIGLMSQPLQLFHVLALYLVFGIGVDYAIFLSERSHTHEEDAWFAVGLAATSTVLSFGLLALSATPVLRAFGLIMLVGVTVSIIAAPLFCSPHHHAR